MRRTWLVSPWFLLAVAAAAQERPAARPDPDDDGGRRRPMRQSVRVALDGGGEVVVLHGTPAFDAPEGLQLETLAAGEPLLFFETMALKLQTTRPLAGASVALLPGNVAAGYPGTWGLWIVRTSEGYELALTEAPDVWGTQYTRADVVATAPLTHQRDDDHAAGTFTAELVAADRTVHLGLRFGPHRWEAVFALGG